jgi:hypothetical protein
MGSATRLLVLANVVAAGCAKGGGASPDAVPSCGDACDTDGDGVIDATDECPDTRPGEVVNQAGCDDSQVSPTLEPMFPPFGLTWTPTGDLGRAGGLTWTYVGIDRGDLFHIYWVICDDPAQPCGVSLDGPLDPGESWQLSAALSNPTGGQLVFTNATNIVLADTTTVPLSGRLTVTIVDGAAAALPFHPVGILGVPARSATHGAEIPGTAFTVTALVEVQDQTAVWTPYLDYYDAAPTADPGGTAVSFGGSFYSE